MPIKDRSGGPIPDDISNGVATLSPSAPRTDVKIPGAPGYVIPQAAGLFDRARWRSWTAYVVSTSVNNIPNEQTTNFPIYSLVVDNQTSQWFKFKGTYERFIPPWMFGMVMRTAGEQKFELTLIAPPGITQATVSGHYITIAATEEKLPPVAGLPLQT